MYIIYSKLITIKCIYRENIILLFLYITITDLLSKLNNIDSSTPYLYIVDYLLTQL